MSHHSSDGRYRGIWPQQSYGQGGEAHTQSVDAYSSCSRQTHSQPGIDISHSQYQNGDSRNPQYPAYGEQGTPRAPYVQSTGLYQPVTYEDMPLQYDHQSQGWSNSQQSPIVPENQSMMQSRVFVSPIPYTSQSLPLGAPRASFGIGPGYISSNTWPNHPRSVPDSSTVQQTAVGRPTGSAAEHTVPCPYNCGTVLTGVHAGGNMTRHLKSQNCVASGKDKTKHVCPVRGCDKGYIRSDGLKVHLRKQHKISRMPGRAGSSDFDGNGYEYP